MKNKFLYYLSVGYLAINLISCGSTIEKMEKELQVFIDNHVAIVAPLSKETAATYFNASISGKEEDFNKVAELSIQLEKIYASKEEFAKLKQFKESGLIKDELLKRQLKILYDGYLGNQIDEKKLEELVNLSTEIDKKYTKFRAEVGGKELSDNDIEEILATSTKTEEVQETWLASKKVGPVVAEDVVTIVKLRNEVAKELGFDNYHQMSLTLSEQNSEEIEQLFNELDELTREAFAQLKDQIDEHLAKKFDVSKEALMPWHYQNRFFQDAPKIYSIDLDDYYKDKDVVVITKDYYEGIGLNIEDIVAKSDLYEKEGKNQHAYCIDIDKEGDIRVLCNVKNNARWMSTMLHEYGHAVYDKFMDDSIPYLLREPAHTFTTEAIAMLFGRFASNPQWLQDVIGINDEEKAEISEDSFNTLRLEQLTFSRWVQVMYRFEKKMYENPDQDLNKLWWDLVEQYQMIKRPVNRTEPDWATKIHIATSPCYYHNYMLGELLASQLYHTIASDILNVENDIYNHSFDGNKEVGQFLKDRVFAPADIYHWNTMIEKATGEKLTAKYYAKQFVN